MPRNPALNRVVLLPTVAPAGAAGKAPVRRYRLARVRPDGRSAADRFAHLKQAHD